MKLIIVESPTKAKTIQKLLNNTYKVIASKGHVRDLPEFGLGIKIDETHKFSANYTITKDHKEIVEDIKKLGAKADIIYIATDEDREGEAIGYHIMQVLSLKLDKTPRIAFHEITKNALDYAIKNPRNIDMDKVHSQEARRLLDRIVGFSLSSLVSSKIMSRLSAGRVQSATLKIIVDRERQIQDFKSITYYEVFADFIIQDIKIESELVKFAGETIKKHQLQDRTQVESILETLKNASYQVYEIEKKTRITPTPPPFMTTSLQQSASTNLNLSPSNTMRIAQRLYEGVNTNEGVMGVITYMRTDSLNISKEAQEQARKLLEKQYGQEFVPSKPKFYKNKTKNAQEAHEAIRPTNLNFTPEIAKNYLNTDEFRLYKLIYERFLASQSVDAKFQSQSIIISNSATLDNVFKASGSKLIFEGFYKIVGGADKDNSLPDIAPNVNAKLEKLESKQKQTEPPARYSEASLIKKLEDEGIGRPSTYAPTITLLRARNYIDSKNKTMIPKETAFKVIELLERAFENIVDSKFSASLEDKLDDIAQGKLNSDDFLWEFYEPFMEKIKESKENISSQKIAIPTGEKCPTCGGDLVRRNGRYGEFIACNNYPKCKFVKRDEKPQSADSIAEENFGKCEKCGGKMVKKIGRNGEFIACNNYPKCKNTKSLSPKTKEVLEVPCPKCGNELIKRISRRGVFYGCSNYPECKFISAYPLINKKCEKCGAAMVEKNLKSGITYECLFCKHKIKLTKE